MESYISPIDTQRFETEVKRSRFITTVSRTTDRLGAKAFVTTIRKEFPDANHHCWAMVASRPDDVYQQDQSDDGEPKGTAGKPMLNVLQHANMGNIVVVVTRYFGGIKLGTGGLTRAYSQSVSEALRQLNTEITYIREAVTVALPYTSFDQFEHWLKTANISLDNKEFTHLIMLELQVPAKDIKALKQKLRSLQGNIVGNNTD